MNGRRRITDSHLSGDGPVQAMRQAMADAGLTPAAVDCVNAHGIATLNELDPALAPLPVSSSPQAPRSELALIFSRGFSGMNVALLVRIGGSQP